MHVRFLSLLLFAILLSNYAPAQVYSFGNYTVKEGLIQSNVQSIAQDQEGYLWLGTDGGLSRFDGKEFLSFGTQNGLQEAGIKTIAFDRTGVLWIGHATGKITTYTGKKYNNYALKKEDQGFRIHHILCDSKDRLWVCTQGNGVYRIDPNSRNSYVKIGTEQGLTEDVFKAYEDREGNIWFVTYVGIKLMESQTGKFVFYKPNGLPFYTYTCIAQDHDKNIWLGTQENGLIKFNPATGALTEFNSSNGLGSDFITSVVVCQDSSIWAGSWKVNESNGELIRIRGNTLQTFSSGNGLPGEKVLCIFSDKSSTIWAGMYNKGLSRFRGFTFSHYTGKSGLGNEVVNCVSAVSNTVWAGTDEGIDLFTRKPNGSLQFLKHINTSAELGSGLVTCLLPKEGTILVSTFRGDIGFYSLNGTFLRSISINNNLINTMAVTPDNMLWIGSVNGLTGYHLKTGEFRSFFKTEDYNILSILPYEKGLLLGTRENGLIYYDGKEFIKNAPGLAIGHASPVVLAGQKDGTLWIGTEGGGIYYGKENALRNLRVKDGLTSDYITSINFTTNNQPVIATNKGICIINIQKDALQINQFQEPEGLLYPEIAINSTGIGPEGLYFGTSSGLGHFDTQPRSEKQADPKVILNGMRLLTGFHEGTSHNVLSYDQKEITFLFSAINLINPERTRFRYKLNGFDADWQSSVEINNAHYTNLSPGDYEFIVEVSNGIGRWSANAAHYRFTVKPPFWQTTWFIATALFVMIFSLWAFVFFRTRYLERTKKILETVVTERTQEIKLKNLTLEEANKQISNKNKEITDSINYAKKIQDAILPAEIQINQHFPESFIYFKPKDIVSGDFYWFFNEHSSSKLLQGISTSEKPLLEPAKGRSIIAVADCTGHGVPGAFMCMIGSSLLNQIVRENSQVSVEKILGLLNAGIQNALRQTETETQDGMDIALIEIDSGTGKMDYAGAMRPILLLRGEAYCAHHGISGRVCMQELKPDKTPIGGIHGNSTKEFTKNTIQLWPKDTVYLFTDGYADQFGGNAGKKLMTKKFKELIASIHHLPMHEQHHQLDEFITAWRGRNFQVDDMLVVGIQYHLQS